MEKFEISDEWIKSVLSEIIQKVHRHPEKKRIAVHPGAIHIACPYCGDSNKFPNKKRGVLYTKDLFFKCWNEGCKADLNKMIDDFKISVDPKSRLAIGEYIQQNLTFTYTQSGDELLFTELDKVFDLNDLVNHFNGKDSEILNFMPIQKNSPVEKELNKRKIFNRINIWQCDWKKGWNISPAIVILNRKDNKVVSFQVRNLEKGKNRAYKIFNWSTISRHMNKEIDPHDSITYDLLSKYIGIMQVDFSKKIYILEGALDATFLPNSIGLVGSNTPTKVFEESQLDICWVFDNDPAGQKKSKEHINKNQKVFLWKKFLRDLNFPVGIKDLNDVILFSDVGNMSLKFVPNYFSTDRLDFMFV